MKMTLLVKILSAMTSVNRKYRSDKVDFVSANALFYKVLGQSKQRNKNKKTLKGQD